jgi:hypothetical protein
VNEYRSAEWHAFRREVIALDGSACNRCGARADDGAVLQVHHKQYLAGRKPWEYPFQLCEAICRGCHAVEHGKSPPKTGWEFIGCDDLGDISGSCDYCGEQIRHVFLVCHPAWSAMEVGTVCCDKLTSTDEASAHMAAVARTNTRRKTFVSSPRWYTGGPPFQSITQRTSEGRRVQITVSPARGGYMLTIEGRTGKQIFLSITSAKAAAFDACQFGKLDAWLQRTRRGRRQTGGSTRTTGQSPSPTSAAARLLCGLD